jgi:hypothetical protein
MTTANRKTTARKTPARKAPAPKVRAATKTPSKASAPVQRKAARPDAPKAPSKPQASAPKPSAAKPAKSKKPKLVRDSFTIPKAEYAAIDLLKRRAATLGRTPKKSELLRAGLMVLSSLTDSAFSQALAAVPAIKTGRPKA